MNMPVFGKSLKEWLNYCLTKQRQKNLYRDQAEFIKPNSDNNDPAHMSVHNGFVVLIILTSEAKNFQSLAVL